MPIFSKKKEDTIPMPPQPPSASGLDDIKQEVSGAMPPPIDELPQPPIVESAPTPEMMQPPMPQSPETMPLQEPQVESSQMNSSTSTESLFNLDDFELPDLDVHLDTTNDTSSAQSLDSQREELKSSFSNLHANSEFMPTKGLSTAKDDTYFLTTTEFKHLLEQIDSVKSRIKTTAQRHMRVMSIKAEEDIELESLRKDFQFIEDKLYEVDSTIFDR